MPNIINERIAGLLLSVPDNIAGPKSRKAVEKALEAKRARQRASGVLTEAEDARNKIKSIIEVEYAARLEDDPSAKRPKSDRARLDKAQADLEDARIDAHAHEQAEARRAQKVREAVAEELPLLRRAAVVDGDVALAMLAATLEDAEAARDALWGSIGIGHMVARLVDDPGAPIAIQHKAYGYTFDLEAAIEGLREALTKAAEEHAALKADLKGTAGSKARKPRKPASEAPVAAPTPSAAELALGDLSIGGDDDE